MRRGPFADKEKAAEEKEKLEAAEERLHVGNLMRSESGLWLLRRLVGKFESEIRRKSEGHNSVDSYHRGIQDHAKEYRDLVIKHFGHSGLDKIAKGTT